MDLKPAKYKPPPTVEALLEVSANDNNKKQQFTASSQQQQESFDSLTNEKKIFLKERLLHLRALDEANKFSQLPVGVNNHFCYQKYIKNNCCRNKIAKDKFLIKLKSIELSIIDLVLLSTIAAKEFKFDLSLSLAKESLECLNGLKVMLIKQQQDYNDESNKDEKQQQIAMTTNVSLFELCLLVDSNLAAQLKNSGQLRESIELYTNLCKLASFSNSSGQAFMTASQSMSSSTSTTSNNFDFIHNNQAGAAELLKRNNNNSRSSFQFNSTAAAAAAAAGGGNNSNISKQQQYETRILLHKFGLNIGNIYHQLCDYKRALKYYRITLDRISSMTNLNQGTATKLNQQRNLRQLKLKLMNNIGLTLLAIDKQANNNNNNNDGFEVVSSFNLLLADNCLLLPSQLPLDKQQQQQQQEEQSNNIVYSCYNSNHHTFGLNLMICYEKRSNFDGMINALKSLVKVDICHQYQQIFNFNSKILNSFKKSNCFMNEDDDNNNNDNDNDNEGRWQFLLSSFSFNTSSLLSSSSSSSSLAAHAYQLVQSNLKNNRTYEFDQIRALDNNSAKVNYNDDDETRQPIIVSDLGEITKKLTNEMKTQHDATNDSNSLNLNKIFHNINDDDDDEQELKTNPELFKVKKEKVAAVNNSKSLSFFNKAKLFKLVKKRIILVMNSIQNDRLEKLIEDKQKQIINSILMSCNLILELEITNKKQLSQNKQTIDDYGQFSIKSSDLSSNSVTNFCINVLNDSKIYRYLSYDLKLSKTINSLINERKKIKLNETIEIMKQIDFEQSKLIVDNIKLTPMVAINLSLFNLFQLTNKLSPGDNIYINSKDKTNKFNNRINKSIDLLKFAINLDQSNIISWINLANCFYFKGDLELAKKIYEKKIFSKFNFSDYSEANYWEANYNLTLINRLSKQNYNEISIQQQGQVEFENNNNNNKKLNILQINKENFIKLISKNLILSSLQLALIYRDSLNDREKSIEIFKDLIVNSKQGPEVHLIFSKLLDNNNYKNDVQTTLNGSVDKDLASKSTILLQQANKEHPYNLPVLEKLIALNINNFDYKTARELILNCLKIRPDQTRWYQMLAECFRRDADYMKAIKVYQIAINKFPNDTSCLKALIKLTNELGLEKEKNYYIEKLNKLMK